MARYDKHPQRVRFDALVQSANNVNTDHDLEFFEPVPVGKNKTLIVEILSIDIHLDLTGVAAGRTVAIDLKDKVTEKPLFNAKFKAQSGTGFTWTQQYDLSDKQGNGMLITKNPFVTLSSVGLTSTPPFEIGLIWRYVEVTNTELVQLLGGI